MAVPALINQVAVLDKKGSEGTKEGTKSLDCSLSVRLSPGGAI